MVLTDKININCRLLKALSFVDNCRCMADIGSDHGYSSIYAIRENVAKRVIATDISKPSLEKTERLVRQFDLCDRIECRVGDGFSVLQKNEADVAFVAGMGADLIADIIEQSESVAKNFDYMVLQPMNSAVTLRKRLINMGYRIDRESIVIDNDKFYQILRCSVGKQENVTQEALELGFYVFKERIPLCAEYIAHVIKHYENILRYIGKNDTFAAANKINEVDNKIKVYKEALKWATAQ